VATYTLLSEVLPFHYLGFLFLGCFPSYAVLELFPFSGLPEL
jgi:hypothetical protein